MKYKVDGWNNFCRIFEIPNEYPPGFCFGGGIRTNFQMVDFFYPISKISQACVTKEVWVEKVGPIESIEIDLTELEQKLIPFLQAKEYVKPDRQYLILYSFGGSTVFSKENTKADEQNKE